MWVENVDLKSFGHLLAQQVASNHSIDPADGVESVPNLEPAAGFNGNIIIEEKKKALEEAKKHCTGAVLGSKLSQGNVGAAVCWKDKDCNSWKSISAFLGKKKETVDGELWAIANGLEVARKTTLNSHNTPITIFSDSQEALAKLRQLSSHTSAPYLRSLIYQETSDLESKGHFVTIRWIPSHVGLVGHDKADRSARDKARRGGGGNSRAMELTQSH